MQYTSSSIDDVMVDDLAPAVGVVAVRRVGVVPRHWHPIYALTDPKEDVVVVTFDTNRPCDF
jgi:hypothetical protein